MSRQESNQNIAMIFAFGLTFFLMAVTGLMHWTLDRAGVEDVTRDQAIVELHSLPEVVE